MTYRLVVREVPEALAAKESGVQLPIALVLNMPVFVTPKSAQREMTCVLASSKAQVAGVAAIGVSCENSGNAYAQLRSVELNRNGKTLARFDGGLYLLPGVKKTLPLKLEADALMDAGAAELTLTYDDRKQQTFSVSVP
jgi:fimbrial chaperone protein